MVQGRAPRECWPETGACDETGWEVEGGGVLEEGEGGDGDDEGEEEGVHCIPSSKVYRGSPWKQEDEEGDGEVDGDEDLSEGGRRVSSHREDASSFVVAVREAWKGTGEGQGKDRYCNGGTGCVLLRHLSSCGRGRLDSDCSNDDSPLAPRKGREEGEEGEPLDPLEKSEVGRIETLLQSLVRGNGGGDHGVIQGRGQMDAQSHRGD